MVASELSEKQLSAFSKFLGLPMKQHHVTVYADGRIYFHVRANIPPGDWRVRDASWSHNKMYCFTFEPFVKGKTSSLGHLWRNKSAPDSMVYRCNRISRSLVRRGTHFVRLRITKFTRYGPDGSFRIYLRTIPVVDMYSIWQNITGTAEKPVRFKRKK